MCSMSTRKPADRPEQGRYRGSRIAVGTRHGKQHQFAPSFSAVLGAVLITPADLDTDRFGTFTGERPRRGPALDAARGKARLAMDLTGLPLALASEASYGPPAGLGWTHHEEILLFCDDELGIEVLEGCRTASVAASRHCVADYDEVPSGLLEGLGRQALIVRPSGEPPDPDGIVKGITTAAALRTAIATAAALSTEQRAVVEPDLRAHHNPGRREVLVTLARRLAHRLATGCPSCSAPGFGRVDAEAGLPCRLCGTPTAQPRAEIHACAACGHSLHRPVVQPDAEPAHCPSCNP